MYQANEILLLLTPSESFNQEKKVTSELYLQDADEIFLRVPESEINAKWKRNTSDYRVVEIVTVIIGFNVQVETNPTWFRLSTQVNCDRNAYWSNVSFLPYSNFHDYVV